VRSAVSSVAAGVLILIGVAMLAWYCASYMFAVDAMMARAL
jgi:hypothetical protein